jgi:KDO2-lipid IV(A) lauroyltransferase
MDRMLYWCGRMLLECLQRLPLSWVANLGRAGGRLAYHLDRRHCSVALANLRAALGDTTAPRDLRRLARENLQRIGENFACAARTARMSAADIDRVLTVQGLEWIQTPPGEQPRSRVFAIGHFGNFELYARTGHRLPSSRFATTYRALRQPGLNRLLQEVREQSGCLYFERRNDAEALKRAMHEGSIFLGLLADQHAGDHGIRVRFFGRDCSASPAPAVLALRYGCPLHVAICYRLAKARWQIEVSPPIATHAAGQRRSVSEITEEIQRQFEEAVRRDPANWFWVHNRWKPVRRPRSATEPPRGDASPLS